MFYHKILRIRVIAAGMVIALAGCGIVCHFQEKADASMTGKDYYGGGMVYNAALFSEDIDPEAPEESSFFSYELPLISDHEVKEISVTEINVSGEGTEEGGYLIRPDGFTSGDFYNGWYYYYIHLKAAMSQDHPISLTVDSVDLMIDNLPYTYIPYEMRFYNTRGMYRDLYTDDADILFYHDPPSMICSHIPDDEENPMVISLEAGENCTIKSIEALDFLDIVNLSCKINEEETDWHGGSLPVKKDDIIELSFNLKYQDGISDEHLVKSSRILLCEDSRGNTFLFNEPQGFSIIGFENDQMIHTYIDQELSDA